MRLISRVKVLAGALLLAGCLTQQAAAASFVTETATISVTKQSTS